MYIGVSNFTHPDVDVLPARFLSFYLPARTDGRTAGRTGERAALARPFSPPIWPSALMERALIEIDRAEGRAHASCDRAAAAAERTDGQVYKRTADLLAIVEQWAV